MQLVMPRSQPGVRATTAIAAVAWLAAIAAPARWGDVLLWGPPAFAAALLGLALAGATRGAQPAALAAMGACALGSWLGCAPGNGACAVDAQLRLLAVATSLPCVLDMPAAATALSQTGLLAVLAALAALALPLRSAAAEEGAAFAICVLVLPAAMAGAHALMRTRARAAVAETEGRSTAVIERATLRALLGRRAFFAFFWAMCACGRGGVTPPVAPAQ